VVGRFPTVISDASGEICGCAQSATPCYQEVWLWLTRTMGTKIEDEEINTSRIRAFVMRWVDMSTMVHVISVPRIDGGICGGGSTEAGTAFGW